MLSPSIITKSNGNCCRSVFIRSATSYCGASPVPMSPIAANLTEPILSGNLNSSARTQKTIKVDRKSTRLNSSHQIISYAVFCLKKKKRGQAHRQDYQTQYRRH